MRIKQESKVCCKLQRFSFQRFVYIFVIQIYQSHNDSHSQTDQHNKSMTVPSSNSEITLLFFINYFYCTFVITIESLTKIIAQCMFIQIEISSLCFRETNRL